MVDGACVPHCGTVFHRTEKVKTLQQQMAQAAVIRTAATASLETAKHEAKQTKQSCENTLEARRVLQAVAQSIQQMIHARIATVVSRCLSAVFDEPYEFRIKFVQKRGKTEAELVFVRNGMEIDPLTASGGGVVDVASFALRLASLMLTRPAPRKLIVADEPFRFLSAEYRGRIREMLLELSEQMGIQFVIVTHVRELECGKVIRIGGE